MRTYTYYRALGLHGLTVLRNASVIGEGLESRMKGYGNYFLSFYMDELWSGRFELDLGFGDQASVYPLSCPLFKIFISTTLLPWSPS